MAIIADRFALLISFILVAAPIASADGSSPIGGSPAPWHSKRAFGRRAERYSWKTDIVTTVFWIGEPPSENNPVPNRSSSWDKNWRRSYGGSTIRTRRIEAITYR